MALKVASIYLTDPERKVEGGFDFYDNGFPNGLVPDILLTAVLLGLGTNKGP